MSKSFRDSEPTPHSDSFEIIEFAIGDLDTLARAFEIIEEVCEQRDHPSICLSQVPDKVVLN